MASSRTKNDEEISNERVYEIDGRCFLVQSISPESSTNTLTDVLLRLMKAEVEND